MDTQILLQELKNILKNLKKQPYLPFWGEIFSVLYKIQKLSIKNKKDIFFYNIESNGKVKYCYKKRVFLIELPEITIHLKINELTNSLLTGRFTPL